MKLPIPDDWNEDDNGWVSLLMCVPNSKMWRAIIRGAISDLTGGRAWDERTGRITAVQVIAWQIYGSIEMGCVEELVKSNRMLVAALLGQQVDLEQPMPLEVDFTETGMTPRLVAALSELELTTTVDPTPVTVQVDPTPVNITVDPASVTIDNTGLIAKLEELQTMLETRSIAETTAANTRSESEQALLNAIENILGGSYEPD